MIPDYFRPHAKETATRRLKDAVRGGYFDAERYRRIIADVAEDEWRRDRLEFKAWMRMMRDAFERKYHNRY